jgi:hypothetical protein
MTTKKVDNEPLVLTDELRQTVRRAEEGDPSVLPVLRRLLDEHPAVWRRYGNLAPISTGPQFLTPPTAQARLSWADPRFRVSLFLVGEQPFRHLLP